MKAISFLGFNKRGYQETTYLNPLQKGEYKTKFVQEALVEFYKPETLYILLTDTAENGIPDNETESTWKTLQNRLADKVNLKPIFNVPEGHTTDDIWKLFSLLEWTSATDLFIKTGNGQLLSNLLQSSETTTQNLAASIEGIAQGLQLLRPMDVMREAAILPDRINAAASSVSISVPQFAALLGRVEKDYSAFGLQNPTDYQNYPQSSLLRQLKMVDWYAAKGQTVQALSMAREWLPSLVCYHFKLDPLDKQNRDEMELLLNGGKIKDKDGNTVRESVYLDDWSKLPKQKKKLLNKLWGGEFNLANLRNDVLHAGFRKNPKNAQEILEQTKKVIQELQNVAEQWNLQDECV